MILYNKQNLNKLTTIPQITVATPPPIKPSHVFFGDTCISGVRPKKNPNT